MPPSDICHVLFSVQSKRKKEIRQNRPASAEVHASKHSLTSCTVTYTVHEAKSSSKAQWARSSSSPSPLQCQQQPWRVTETGGVVVKTDAEGKPQPGKEEWGRIKLTSLRQHHCFGRWVLPWHKSLWIILLTACRVCLLHNKHLLLPCKQKKIKKNKKNPARSRRVSIKKYCPCLTRRS